MSCYIDMLYPTIKSGWYKRIAARFADYAAYGVRGVMPPPVCITTYVGPDSVSWGYDPTSDLDFGQHGDELRGGTAKDAQNFALAAAAAGMQVRLDFPHQYGIDGDNPPYVEKNSQSKPDKTLAYKPTKVFLKSEDRTGVFDLSGSRGMGQRVNYWASLPGVPNQYMLNLKKQTMGFLKGCFGASSWRLDNGKDEDPRTTRALLAAHKNGVAEVMDGNPDKHLDFINTTGMSTYDFPTYYVFRDIANGAPLSDLVNSRGLSKERPDKCWGIAENHDTDGPNGIIRCKGWWYFRLATMPMAGWDFYWGDDEKYGLWSLVKHYVWIHEVLAFGSYAEAHTEQDLVMWSRDGDGGQVGQSGGLMCGISSDPINTRWVWAYHPKWRNEQVVNYAPSGGPAVWVNGDGWGCYPLPPNSWDRANNAIAYSRPGQSRKITPVPRKVNLTNPLDFSEITVKL